MTDLLLPRSRRFGKTGPMTARWLLSVVLVLAATGARAATFSVPTGDIGALKNAIAAANSNGEDDVINLGAGFYPLQMVDNFTNGGTALPVLTADGGRALTINGNNAILARAAPPSSPEYRILQVGPNANVALNRLTIQQGEIAGPGGGIYNDGGRLTLVECTLAGNSARTSLNSNTPVGPFYGGALNNRAGTVALRSCTFRDNLALGIPSGSSGGSGAMAFGGAIYNDRGTVTAESCTFTNNTVNVSSTAPGPPSTPAAGGAIASIGSAGQPARVTIANSTFSGNVSTATTGSGGFIVGTALYAEGASSNSTIEIGSSIITGPQDPMMSGAPGAIKSHGYNLTSGNGNGILTAIGDLTNTDPLLQPLANNGGATATHAIGVASPALDRGKRDAVPGFAATTDQRGAARPIDYLGFDAAPGGDGSDIGAFEKDAPNLVVTTTADHDDGACDAADCTLREAIIAANQQPSRDTIGFAPGVSGTIGLTSALPIVDKSVDIAGPGADVLTVRRESGGTYRLLLISNGTSTGPEVSIAGLTLTNGQMAGSAAGGCIYNDFATLRLVRCAVVGNTAGNGAGILNFRGTVSAYESTISNNTASGFGGAFFNSAAQGPATITLINSTVTGNTAGRGAAVHNAGSTGAAKLILHSCTIAENSAPLGSIFNDGPNATNVTLRNTIVKAGASGATIVSGNSATVTSQGNNISSDAIGGDGGTGPGGAFSQPGDMRNTDPRLDTAGLKDNGGPTPTLALLSNSPAINAGNGRAPSLDQRGFLRDGIPDIGAFEFGAALPTPPPTPTPSATPTPPATPTPTPVMTPTPPPNRFANISTRLRVETGDNVLIGGFIVTGSMQKRIIVRALGPSLPVEDRLANPLVELYDSNAQLIAANDNWQEAANAQEIVDSTIPPPNELEAAILRNVDIGAYTAVVRDVADGEGIGLVEVYDLGDAQDSRLPNISTRGRVLTGDNVMIGGLIATGSHAQKVIVRAIGPSLGIAGQLEDPLLELFDGNGNPMGSNDNWKDTQQPDIEATTIPPSNDLESAIVTFLPPGPYTAVIRGVNDTTGVALVEVYGLQQQ